MRRSLILVAVVAVVMGLGMAAALAQTISWVSVSSTGSGGDAPLAVSDNGRFVAFMSESTNLVPGDTNGNRDIFVKDVQTGAVQRVSVSTSGAQGNANSGNNTVDISNDGRYVLFDSLASNLVAGDTNGQEDLFVRDRQTNTTSRIVADGGGQIGRAFAGSLSGNGRYVGFVRVDAGNVGLYRADRTTGDVERVIEDAALNDALILNSVVSMSDDARYFAFITGQFQPNREIIWYDRQTDTWEVANPRLGGAAPQSTIPAWVRISGNGRFVTFHSGDTNLVAGDTANTTDVFVYDSTANSLERIPAGWTAGNEVAPAAISDNGRYLAFSSGTSDLYDPAPGNGRVDVVVYDRNTKTGTVVSKHDDGSLGNSNSSHLRRPGMSGDGRYVAFRTQEGFDTADTTAIDVYIVDRQGTPAQPPPPPGGRFVDDNGHIFENAIEWLAAKGITEGCNPPTNNRFCPDLPVTRGQMAAFLVRAFSLPAFNGPDRFRDDDGHIFEGAIERLAQAGITVGCNPPANNRFCPDERVTRGQMAAFLVRSFGLPAFNGPDRFRDDDGSVFEGAIERLAQAGITVGCNPPANDRFCPSQPVTRGQMATFLKRAFGE